MKCMTIYNFWLLKADRQLSVNRAGCKKKKKGRITKGLKETFGYDGYVHSLDCGDSFILEDIGQIASVVYTLNMYCFCILTFPYLHSQKKISIKNKEQAIEV